MRSPREAAKAMRTLRGAEVDRRMPGRSVEVIRTPDAAMKDKWSLFAAAGNTRSPRRISGGNEDFQGGVKATRTPRGAEEDKRKLQ